MCVCVCVCMCHTQVGGLADVVTSLARAHQSMGNLVEIILPVCMETHIHTHTGARTHTHTHTGARAHTHTHTHAHCTSQSIHEDVTHGQTEVDRQIAFLFSVCVCVCVCLMYCHAEVRLYPVRRRYVRDTHTHIHKCYSAHLAATTSSCLFVCACLCAR